MDYDKWKLDNNESDICACPMCEEEVNEKDLVKTNYLFPKYEYVCEFCAEKIKKESESC